jgi:hypothetical protein
VEAISSSFALGSQFSFEPNPKTRSSRVVTKSHGYWEWNEVREAGKLTGAPSSWKMPQDQCVRVSNPIRMSLSKERYIQRNNPDKWFPPIKECKWMKACHNIQRPRPQYTKALSQIQTDTRWKGRHIHRNNTRKWSPQMKEYKSRKATHT